MIICKHRIALDSMPWALDKNQPFPDGYADYCPMGQCPNHGLEPYLAVGREVNTGAGDLCIAMVFLCGKIDPDSVF